MTAAEAMRRIEQLVAQGQVAQAADQAASALWELPDQPELLLALAALKAHLGELELAIGSYERACAVVPERADAWRGLADALHDAGRSAEAAPALARLHALAPPVWQQVTIEITTYCNLRCRGCARTIESARGNWTNQHMSLADFQRIIDVIPPTGAVVTQGVGEPTMHPDLPAMVAYAAAAGKFGLVCFTTNALARQPDYYQQLFDRGLNHLMVSVDSLQPALAETVRAGTDTDRLRERLSALLQRHPGRVIVEITLGRTNVEGLVETLADLAALGAQRVNIHPFDDMGIPDDVLNPAQKAAVTQILPELRAAFPSLALEFHNVEPSPEICRLPWLQPAIRVDGALTPCCRILDDGGFSFGNLREQRFEEVWFGTLTERWRQAFEQRTPEVCAGCPMYLPR